MEIIGGLKKNLRRRNYQRLDDRGKDARVIRLGGRRKRSCRIRGLHKLKLRISFVSPIKFLAKVRDAYVNMMLGLESKGGHGLQGDDFFGTRKIIAGSRKISKAEELQAKLILEIYKSLKASRERELASQY